MQRVLAPVLRGSCPGAIEGRGLIVGGWRNAASEGTYGIRVWLTSADMRRLGKVDRLATTRRWHWLPHRQPRTGLVATAVAAA